MWLIWDRETGPRGPWNFSANPYSAEGGQGKADIRAADCSLHHFLWNLEWEVLSMRDIPVHAWTLSIPGPRPL